MRLCNVFATSSCFFAENSQNHITMNTTEEIKKMVLSFDGVNEVSNTYFKSLKMNCLFFKKDNRSFYIGPNDYHKGYYCDWIDNYWVINTKDYSIDEIKEILKRLFQLLPKYDTVKMVNRLRKLADQLGMPCENDYDEIGWGDLATILTNAYLLLHKLKDDEFGVLHKVVGHSCLKVIIGMLNTVERN